MSGKAHPSVGDFIPKPGEADFLFRPFIFLPITEQGRVGVVSDVRLHTYTISNLPIQAQEQQKKLSEKLLEGTADFEKDVEVKTMIGELAQAYYAHHVIQENPQKRPLTINPFLENGSVLTTTSQPVQAAIFAIQGAASKRNGWEQKEGMGPQYKHISKAGSVIVEYNSTDRTTSLNSTMTTSLWKEIEQFSDKDVDTLLIALGYLAASKEPSVWIYAADILDHRGIAPIMKKDTSSGKERRAGHRKEDIEDYAMSLSRIANIWVTIRQLINDEEMEKGNRKRRKRKQYTHTGRILSIDEIWHQKELNFDTGEYENHQPIGWKIRGGDWLRTFLEFPNKQVASLCQAILKYDPHNEMWEKRLAYYLFFHGHFNKPQGGSTILNRTIKDILEINSLDIDTRNPQRSRERFEKAMGKLGKDGIINTWSYAGDIQLPPKRWLDIWLNQTIRVDITTQKALP